MNEQLQKCFHYSHANSSHRLLPLQVEMTNFLIMPIAFILPPQLICFDFKKNSIYFYLAKVLQTKNELNTVVQFTAVIHKLKVLVLFRDTSHSNPTNCIRIYVCTQTDFPHITIIVFTKAFEIKSFQELNILITIISL